MAKDIATPQGAATRKDGKAISQAAVGEGLISALAAFRYGATVLFSS